MLRPIPTVRSNPILFILGTCLPGGYGRQVLLQTITQGQYGITLSILYAPTHNCFWGGFYRIIVGLAVQESLITVIRLYRLIV